jgi:hypothetical protein
MEDTFHAQPRSLRGLFWLSVEMAVLRPIITAYDPTPIHKRLLPTTKDSTG